MNGIIELQTNRIVGFLTLIMDLHTPEMELHKSNYDAP